MSPGNTAQLLSALASPARKREFLRTTENGRPREPPSVALGELLKLPAHAIKRRQLRSLLGDVSGRCCTNGTHTLMGVANRYVAFSASNATGRNLLAAQPGVGHIRSHGAVAEWLKAAVC
jgi:hypothetical protein